MRSVLLGVCLLSAAFFGCSSSDAESGSGAGAAGVAGKSSGGSGGKGSAGEGGEGGEGGSEVAGSVGDAGAAGASGSGACLEEGKGEIELVVEGLPATVAASVAIAGPHESLESESNTLSDVPGGTYTVSAKRVYDADPLVRTAYDAQISSPSFCLEGDGSQTVTVTYSKVVPSNQLWTINAGDDSAPLLGFAASTLASSGSPAATSTPKLPIGTSMAFDHEGNLWAAGATLAEPTVTRYAAAWLAGVGEPHADFAFNLAFGCIPAVKAVALDSSGNVWLSGCGKQVVRVDRPEATPGASDEAIDIEPNVTLSGFSEQNEDLAFDGAGNLWVAAGGQVLRFDKARLGHDDAAAPDLALSVTTEDTTPKALAANFLAFDVAGNLWASDFDGNTVFEVAKTDLATTGTSTVVAKAHVTVDVLAVMSRPAFDDEGSLWLSLAAGKFGKLTAEQLAVNSDAGSPTAPAVVISSPAVGYADTIAFFPAASGLPLLSAQP